MPPSNEAAQDTHLVYPRPGQSISCLKPGVLWLGATPRSDQDFSCFGDRPPAVFEMAAELASFTARGCRLEHYPLVDNIEDKATDPPTLKGMTLTELFHVVREVADRIYKGAPTVVLCREGMSRSALVVGLASRLLGNGPEDTIKMIRQVRGPTALNGGNANFLKLVTDAVRA